MKCPNQDRIALVGVEEAVRVFLPYGKDAADTHSRPDWASDPTTQIYAELLVVWHHFNKHIFGERLRPCIITLRCGGRAAGYYAQQRFQTQDGSITIDEIALNAEVFHARTLIDNLSTLCHESVHALQAQYGHPSDGGYHNKEWADWMERIGLIPSDTGQEGGAKTGVRMSHYIQPDGPFARACADLIAQGMGISFIDRWAAMAKPKANPENNPRQNRREARRKSKVASKSLYGCETCGQRAWGKTTLKIDCRRCRQPMVPPKKQGVKAS